MWPVVAHYQVMATTVHIFRQNANRFLTGSSLCHKNLQSSEKMPSKNATSLPLKVQTRLFNPLPTSLDFMIETLTGWGKHHISTIAIVPVIYSKNSKVALNPYYMFSIFWLITQLCFVSRSTKFWSCVYSKILFYFIGSILFLALSLISFRN